MMERISPGAGAKFTSKSRWDKEFELFNLVPTGSVAAPLELTSTWRRNGKTPAAGSEE